VRDAEILIKGGYQLLSVTPVDQFRHSAHIELVGIFEKPVQQKKATRRLLG
jgi:23S rRNA (uracil1939-C5)-methyltransferase